MTLDTALIHEVAASSEITDLLHRALQQFDGPQSASKIVDKLPKASRPTLDEADRLLQEEVSTGRLWQYPDNRKKPQFWIQSPIEFAKFCLIRKLQGPPLTRSEALVAALSRNAFEGLSKAVRAKLLDEMVRNGDIYELRPFLGSRSKPISCLQPDPADYMRNAVKKIAATLGIAKEEILKSAVAFATRELQELEVDRAESMAETPVVIHTEPTSQDERLLEAMRTVNPRVDDGDALEISALRRELDAHMPGKDFDIAVLDAVSRRRFAIHRYDRPTTITDKERSQMIRDDEGHYYNTISLWRN